MLKINEAKDNLIRVERVLGMINEAMQEAILILRRLLELARDPDEKHRLETFMNGALGAIKAGAAEGFKNAA